MGASDLSLEESVSVRIEHDITIAVYLDEGEWTVRLDGREAAVTYLQVHLGDGRFWLANPKGVFRRPNGVWAAAERNLIGALLRPDGAKGWAAVPQRVKDAIQTAYAEHITQLPSTLPIP